MLHFEALFSCILIAATGSAAGSPVIGDLVSFRGDAVRPAYKDILGPSLPNDTVYVELLVPFFDTVISILDQVQIVESTFETCQYEAPSRGGQFYEFFEDEGICNIYTLQFPLCRTKQGQYTIYIQPQFLTNGTDDDGTIVGNLNVSWWLWSYLSNPGDDYGTFRVQSPTILDFPDYYTSTDSISNQTVFIEDDSLVEVDDDILVDPVCYTNNACGVPFIYPSQTVPANVTWFNKNCGKVVYVKLGQPLYLLSHEGIGCQYFPNAGYGGTCRVNYRGFSNKGIIITVALVNFVDDDSCDGFSLTVVSYNTQTNTTITKLCHTSVKEIFSPVSRGRIDFSGSAKTGRKKYGFIIKLRDA